MDKTDGNNTDSMSDTWNMHVEWLEEYQSSVHIYKAQLMV